MNEVARRSTALLLGAGLAVGATSSIVSSCGSSAASDPETPADATVASDAHTERVGDAHHDVGSDTRDAPDAPAEASSDGSVLTNTAAWQPLGTWGACELSIRDLAKHPLPVRQWSDCGPGCRVTDAQLVSAAGAWVPQVGSAGAHIAGETYLRTVSRLPSSDAYTIVERMSDGAAVAAVRVSNYSVCPSLGGNDDSPLLIATVGEAGDGGVLTTAGLAAGTTSGLVDWQSTSLEVPGAITAHFSFGSGWGMATADGRERLVTSLATPRWTQAIQGTSPTWSIASGSDRLYFAQALTPGPMTLNVYTPQLGTSMLVSDSAGIVSHTGASEAAVAWVDVHGPLAESGRYEAAELGWGPAVTSPSEFHVSGKVSPKASGDLLTVRTAGDYIVTRAEFLEGGVLAPAFEVVKMSTGQLWIVNRLRPSAKSAMTIIFAVTPTELVAGEVDAPPSPRLHVDRIVRLSFDHLDEFAKW